jgi:hypothetical protein
MTDIPTADDFMSLIGKAFQAEGHTQTLVLTSVDTRVPPGWQAAPRKPFSLLLRGPAGEVVPEGFYRFVADGARDFELYLVPIQTHSREYQDYQIVFN